MALDEQDRNLVFGNWPISRLVGLFLVVMGVGVLMWVVLQIGLLFSHPGGFSSFQAIVPERLVVIEFEGEGLEVLLPRELVAYGLLLALLTLAGKIGEGLLSQGMRFLRQDVPRRRERPGPGSLDAVN